MNLAFFGPGFGGAAPAAAYFVPPGGNAFGGIGMVLQKSFFYTTDQE